jgi:hypothetical protein
MNPNDVAPMIIGVFFFVTTAAVILLRPITKRLGSYLEVLAEERRRSLTQQPVDRSDTVRLTAAIEALESRLAQVEEHQDFTNRLLSERTPDKHSLPR